ncbi:MAG: chemotaxis protein CheW [Methanosarcinales archaeon]|nr:chemotaxis protein CheW [Methanosarcinales archaeon]
MSDEADAKTAPEEMQLVVYHLGDEEYGVEVGQVREIIRMETVTIIPKAPFYIEGVINLRGQVTTVVNMRTKFGLEDIEADQHTRIIVAELGDLIVGMTVDSVTEVMRVSRSSIEPTPSIVTSGVDSDCLKGVCKLDNRLLILMDLYKVLSEDELGQVNQISNMAA